MKKLFAILVLSLAGGTGAAAGTKTLTLDVSSMTCATCPITVRKALENVDGVIEAKVTWAPKEAVVTFDDSKTSVDALTEATKNAGFPSTAKE